MYFIKWFILFYCFSLISLSQNYNISGYIINKSNGELLIGSNILSPKLKIGTTSNSYGYYSLKVPLGQNILICSYTGYKSDTLKLHVISDTIINFEIIPKSTDLFEVNVQSKKTSKAILNNIDIPINDVEKTPAFLGEKDILKSLQLFPGIQSGNEGATGFYVRGGGPEQNLILLDGVSIYNSSHLFGFFSIFNNDAIKNINVIKGGFPARFGGRLSSVLELNTKDGNLKTWEFLGGVGLISSNISIRGPIIKNKTSVIISGRRSWIDLLSKPVIDLIQTNLNSENSNISDGQYFFYDLNAKINHKFLNDDKLSFSFYSGKDYFLSNYSSALFLEKSENYNLNSTLNAYSNFGLSLENKTSALKWSHIINTKVLSNTTLLYSKYSMDNLITNNNEIINTHPDSVEIIDVENYDYVYKSGVEDLGIKVDFDYAFNQKHYFKFGISYIKHDFFPGEIQFNSNYNGLSTENNLVFSENIKATDFFIYFEDLFSITNKLLANVGLHYSFFYVNGKLYQSPQPRLSFQYNLNESSSVKTSYTSMQQNIHLLTNSSFGLPNYLWVPATNIVEPQNSQQFVLGYNKYFKNNDYETSLEFFYKKMDNLITFSEGANVISTNYSSWEDKIEMNGQGKSRGLEILFKKNTGFLTGWIGYTWSKSTRQFDQINLGREYPYKFDRTHDFSIVTNYKFSNRLNFNTTWVYGTGNAITVPIAEYFLYSGDEMIQYFEYGSKNNFRLPAYHRLDISCNFIKQKKRSIQTWSVGIYNIYNRKNPFFIILDNEMIDDNIQSVGRQISLFPIMPSIKYNFKF